MMNKDRTDFLVLGVDGQQGRIAARWLLEKGYNVHGIDVLNFGTSEAMSEYGDWSFDQYDVLNQERLTKTIRKRNPRVIVNCALPHTIIPVAEVCRSQGIHAVDLGTGRPKTRSLLVQSKNFRKAGVTYITACGSVPGIGNVMVRHAVEQMDKVDTIEIGFVWDSKPKIFVCPFAIAAILWEYTRPFQYLENGKWKTIKSPDSTAHRRHFNFIGNQKIQQVTHPEHMTMPFYYRKKGLQTFRFWAGFPDHSDTVIRSLIDMNFHDTNLVNVAGIPHRKDWLLMMMLKDKQMPDNYEEWENLWATIEGTKNGEKKFIRMECLVPPRPDWREAGSNIDTGIPAGIIGEMLLKGQIERKGCFSMEAPNVIPMELFFQKLAEDNMGVFQNGTRIN